MAGLPLFPGIFPLGGHAAPDVPLLLVPVQDRSGLGVELGVVLMQPTGDVLVYGGFGNAEMPGGGPDGGTGFNDVHSQFTGSLLNRFCHIVTSDAVCWNNIMPQWGRICALDTFSQKEYNRENKGV